ncbi:hypothetical protein AWH69_00255 [Janibacter melonis]|uniref:Glucosyl-3-phosphoglycerate synthase n=1 Tax=Janibacter melonis TaxID=262209 RepID=A0A176QF00_9MICO|nr:glucosyl-3-phosphoglycerate synthase [Janibacter melonis]OAB88289.1 hypothetical protein AWH69_00255 [Janibacter melonis]
MRAETLAWLDARSSSHEDWPLADLVARKVAGGSRVSVVVPAKDEAATVADVVGGIRSELVDRAARDHGHPLVDELVVVDSDSRDGTAEIARVAGAVVHASAAIRPDLGTHPGKGEALWKSLFVTSGDLLVFVDADLRLWGTHFVTGLLGPLLAHPEIQLVKGYYDRVLDREGEAASTQGGRVTELVARPLLDLWWPELAGVIQPLAGEWAARRELMSSLTVPTGYGVEIATLLDTFARHGLDAIAQVDLGVRAHEHQQDHDLAVMAAELLAVARSRCDGDVGAPRAAVLQQHTRAEGWRERPVPLASRPPAADVPGTPPGGGGPR